MFNYSNHRGFREIRTRNDLAADIVTYSPRIETFKAGETLTRGTAVKLGAASQSTKRVYAPVSLTIIQADEGSVNPGIVFPCDDSIVQIEPFTQCQIIKGGAHIIPDYCYHYSDEIIRRGSRIKVGSTGRWAYTDDQYTAIGEVLEYHPTTKQLIISLN